MSDGVTSSQGGGPSSGAPGRTNSFRGGILVALAALLLLLDDIQHLKPDRSAHPRNCDWAGSVLQPRSGSFRCAAPQDYYGGLVLMMLAILALIASAELPGQRGFAFGPGTAPRLFAIFSSGFRCRHHRRHNHAKARGSRNTGCAARCGCWSRSSCSR